MTHYAHTGSRGEVEHLLCSHRHEDSHAAVEHAHLPHEEVERDHRREAHIHDHGHELPRQQREVHRKTYGKMRKLNQIKDQMIYGSHVA